LKKAKAITPNHLAFPAKLRSLHFSESDYDARNSGLRLQGVQHLPKTVASGAAVVPFWWPSHGGNFRGDQRS
jgi:hypothetical protein